MFLCRKSEVQKVSSSLCSALIISSRNESIGKILYKKVSKFTIDNKLKVINDIVKFAEFLGSQNYFKNAESVHAKNLELIYLSCIDSAPNDHLRKEVLKLLQKL